MIFPNTRKVGTNPLVLTCFSRKSLRASSFRQILKIRTMQLYSLRLLQIDESTCGQE